MREGMNDAGARKLCKHDARFDNNGSKHKNVKIVPPLKFPLLGL